MGDAERDACTSRSKFVEECFSAITSVSRSEFEVEAQMKRLRGLVTGWVAYKWNRSIFAGGGC